MDRNYCFLFIIIGLCFPAWAQNNQALIRYEAKQVLLSDALKALENKSGTTVVFTYDDVASYRVDASIYEKDVRDALDILLEGLPLHYTIKDKYVIISKNREKSFEKRLPVPPVTPITKKEITGRILNRQNQPVEAAFVCLVDKESNLPVAQAISDAEGYFHIGKGEETDGEMKLLVTCLGYKPYISEELTIQEIILEDESQILENVVVIGEKSSPILEQKAGKLVFNVANSINAQGANAFEVLKQLPGISIQEESKTISLNGRNSILILLNGKPTYMQQAEIVDLLKSTSSSSIQSIEIMSNATAQYDASGSGGILNIVLKKENREGYNVMLNLGGSYWLNPKQNTEMAFNYTNDRLNLYGNYSHNFGHVGLFYGNERKQNGWLFDSRSTDTDKRNTVAVTLGMDYRLAENHTVGIQENGNFVFGPGEILTDNYVYDSYTKENLLYHLYSETQYEHQMAARYNFNLNYRYEMPDEQLFTFDADYGLFKGNSRLYQPNTYYSPIGNLDSMQNYRSTGDRDIRIYALSSHYKRTLGMGDLLCGMKYSSVSSSNGYRYYQILKNQDVIDVDASNDFTYLESVLAGYMLYDFSFAEKWQANFGVRVEYTHSNGHLKPLPGSISTESHVIRDYVDVFPSVGVTFRPDEKQSVSLSYGKRIDRPVYSDLNPIEQALDGLSYWKGNPFLIPQRTHRISMQYQYDKTSVELSYSRTKNYSVLVTDTIDTDKIVMEPRNLGTQSYFGFSLSQGLRFFYVWDLTLSGNAYHLDNRMTFDAERYYHRKRWAANFSLQTSFPLVWGIRGELLGVYLTKRPGGSTEVMDPIGFFDIGLQKKFLHGKAAVKLSMSDVLWSNNWGDGLYRMGDWEARYYGYGETRLVKLNFTYTFGGNKQHEAKKSNIDAELNRF